MEPRQKGENMDKTKFRNEHGSDNEFNNKQIIEKDKPLFEQLPFQNSTPTSHSTSHSLSPSPSSEPSRSPAAAKQNDPSNVFFMNEYMNAFLARQPSNIASHFEVPTLHQHELSSPIYNSNCPNHPTRIQEKNSANLLKKQFPVEASPYEQKIQPVLSHLVWIWPFALKMSEGVSLSPSKKSQILAPWANMQSLDPIQNNDSEPESNRRNLYGDQMGYGSLFEKLVYQKKEDRPELSGIEKWTKSLEFHFTDGTFATLADVCFVPEISKIMDTSFFPDKVYSWSYRSGDAELSTENALFEYYMKKKPEPSFRYGTPAQIQVWEEFIGRFYFKALFHVSKLANQKQKKTQTNSKSKLQKAHTNLRQGKTSGLKMASNEILFRPKIFFTFDSDPEQPRKAWEVKQIIRKNLPSNQIRMKVEVLENVESQTQLGSNLNSQAESKCGMGLKVSAQAESDPSLVYIPSGMVYSMNQKTMQFHQHERYFEKIISELFLYPTSMPGLNEVYLKNQQNEVDLSKMLDRYPKLIELDTNSRLTFVFKGSEVVMDILEKVKDWRHSLAPQEYYKRDFNLLIQSQPFLAKIFSESNCIFKPFISIRTPGQFEVGGNLEVNWTESKLGSSVQETQMTTLKIKNFPFLLYRFLDACCLGLSGFNGEHSHEPSWQIYKNEAKRKLYQKLSRHQGLALAVLLEYCNLRLNCSTLGKSITTKIELKPLLWQRIKLLISNFLAKSKLEVKAELKNPESSQLDEYRNLVYDAVEGVDRFFETQGIPVLSPLGAFNFSLNDKGKFQSYFALMKFWIELLVEETGGDILRKERSTLFQKFLESLKGAAGLEIVSSPSLNSRLNSGPNSEVDFGLNTVKLAEIFGNIRLDLMALNMLNMGYEVFINQKKVVFAEDGDLVATIEFSPMANPNSQDEIDYFELNPKVFFKGKAIDLSKDLLDKDSGVIEYQGILYKIPLKQLPRLKTLERFWQKLTNCPGKGRILSLENQIFKVPRSETLEILSLRAAGIPVKGNREWEAICEFYDSLLARGQRGLGKVNRNNLKQSGASEIETDNVEIVFPELEQKLSKSLFKSLQNYQKVGVQWLADLYRLRLGAILADDMGLGKTIQTLAFLEMVRRDKLDESKCPNLIVVPTSLIYGWMAEAQKFTDTLPLAAWGDSTKDELRDWFSVCSGATLLTSFGILSEHSDFFENIKWGVVVFDEAQNLKNLTSARTTVARKLKTRFKIALTGTPMENNLRELFSVVDLVLPGALGSLSTFVGTFEKSEELSKDEAQNLKQIIRPIVMRRTKAEVLQELPPKSCHLLKLDFSAKQRAIYKNIAIAQSEQVSHLIQNEGEFKSQLKMLAALLRLRQVCSDPASVPNIEYKELPPKIDKLVKNVQDHLDQGESVLVFTQFLATQSRIEKTFKERGIYSLSINGATPRSRRTEILTEFNENEEAGVLVMTLKTGGVGLNLTKASVVIHLEPWWNPAVENQATDRAHRMGQEREVTVYRYIMKDSLEEKIELLKERKDRLFSSIFGEAESVVSDESNALSSLGKGQLSPNNSWRLSHEDFKFLISP